jgi:acyl-coenzyme A thioesterase PaaI-like protein
MKLLLSLTKYKPSKKLKQEIHTLEIVKHLDNLHTKKEFSPHYIPKQHFIRGKMYTVNGIEYAHSYHDEMKLITVMKLGSDTIGHVGIVHGGLVAGIFDDLFGELFYSSFKEMGYTASLKIDYRRKMPSLSVVVFVCEVERRDGRKVFLRGRVRGLGLGLEDGDLYAECEALFVIPRT